VSRSSNVSPRACGHHDASSHLDVLEGLFQGTRDGDDLCRSRTGAMQRETPPQPATMLECCQPPNCTPSIRVGRAASQRAHEPAAAAASVGDA
jgi:hypothetical protein